MESCSSRGVSRKPHSGSSSSFSELDEDWTEKIVPTRRRRSSGVARKCCSNGNIQSRHDPERNSLSDRSESTSKKKLGEHPESSGHETNKPRELVTACLDGKNYILPFELLTKRVKEKLVDSKNPNSSMDRYPTEGYTWLDPQGQQEIVNILFKPVHQERVLQKKNLCGDFSFEKCKASKNKSDTGSLKNKNRDKELLDPEGTVRVKSAKELKVDRTPFQCPISSCGDFVCAAFFSSHLKVEHCRVLLEGIIPGQARTILVDPRLNNSGKKHCNIVYYMVNKLRDFGNSEFKNTVPVLLMSSKFTFTELEVDSAFRSNSSQSAPAAQHHQIFWFTGIVSECLKIRYSLEVGSNQRQSGWILPLDQSQDLKSVCQSGTGLILSQSRINQLTRRKDKLLEMRLVLR